MISAQIHVNYEYYSLRVLKRSRTDLSADDWIISAVCKESTYLQNIRGALSHSSHKSTQSVSIHHLLRKNIVPIYWKYLVLDREGGVRQYPVIHHYYQIACYYSIHLIGCAATRSKRCGWSLKPGIKVTKHYLKSYLKVIINSRK